ncbi:aminopeptidase P family protein [Roseococcus sp. SYP-B2431]|uniref:M24 family metallopeptidase n=1 Tax=Roseococcus sp. SYP-B2431 TaxID=2496640 RepID=UPI00103F5C1D|nr:Xaa-Pro peptidase family protein [Roseococcus sp. SYP-B2431]TCH97551.1 aminopeptidase P family protein [Roseococcus sp. SYP-B2431]
MTLSTAVRDHRLALMRRLMDREGYDALAFTGADFFQFATNFATDVQPWERPIVCVVPRDGEPFAVLCELSTNHWRFGMEAQKLWVTDVEFYAEHPRLANRVPLVTEWPQLVADRLRRAGLAKARIGADAAGGMLARATALLPHLKLEGATAGCRQLRWVKHPEELQLLREIAGLTDWVQDRYRENIRPGRLVQELDMSMAALLAEESAVRFPGQHLEIMRCWTLSGPASCAPHGDGRSSGQRIEKGDGLVNIVIPRVNGLVVENERTWFCGKPTPRQAFLFETARAANEAACEAAVSGRPVSGIDAAAQAVIEKAGVADLILHRTGHGMGTMGHEFPEDMAFNHRPLLENEVYSAEPGLYEWGLGGFRHDDTVIVGATPEVITHSPKTLASQVIL